MRLQKLTFSLFFLILSTLTTFAQQPEATPPPEDDKESIKISTTLIQADVTVTDKNGNAVTDLKPEDFEVYENGKKQTITNFSFISIDKTVVQPNTPTPDRKDRNAIPIPPIPLKPEQVRRTYALVVDDLGLNFGNISWVKQSLRKFINEQMQDGDLVAIIRTGSGIGALQSFTSNKVQLLAAVEKIRWNSYGRSGIGTFTPIETTLKEDLSGMQKSDGSSRNPQGDKEDKEFQEQANKFRNENFSVGTLGALNYIIRGMKQLPGRKAVLLFSEGFDLSGPNNRILEQMRIVADLANRSSVVIYALDPRGLVNPLMANADDVVRNVMPSDPALTRMDPTVFDARARTFRESQMSLNYLAKETGGTAFLNQNNLGKGLVQAVNDQSSYYLLGYQPDEATFDPKRSKFNKLEIKVKRKGLNVRYRSGFFGITDERIQNLTPQTPQQKLADALTSPFGASDVNLSLYPVFQNDATNGDIIQALIYIDAKDLKFTQTTDGKQRAVFDIVAMTFGDNGTIVESLAKVYTLDVTEAVYQNMLKNGFVYTLSVPIKKAGAYQFRVAVRDTVSEKIGSASQFIEVPDVKKTLVLSNLILDNFTAVEWQKVRSGGSRDQSERSLLLDTALRQYKRGTILRYDYVIYNPARTQQIESQMRLIKDGKIVYEEKPTDVKTAGQGDPERLSAAGAFSLGTNLEPGNYVLQIIVTDKTNTKKFATQYVEFEIVE